MNYIKLINGFWIANIEHSFTGNETKLYFFLLSISNSLGWKNPFRQSDNQISLRAGISVNSVKSSRNRLSQAGLISFKTGSRGNRFNVKNKCEYKLLSLSAPSTVPPSKTDYDTVDDKGDGKVYDTVDDKGDGQGDINKLNKRKQDDDEKAKKSSSPPSSNLDDSFFAIEVLAKEYLQDAKTVDAVVKNKDNKFKDKNHLKEMIIKFVYDLQERGVKTKTKADFASHFRNWNKKQPPETEEEKQLQKQDLIDNF